MKHNLMGKDKIENLGYTDVNSFENEEQVSFQNFFDYFWFRVVEETSVVS